MDVNQMIVLRLKEICKKEKVNSNIVALASPYKEIREGYMKIISNSFAGISPFMFEENNNRKKHSQEKKMETLKIIVTHFGKIFRDYLKDIKKRYPKNIWKIQNN